MASAGQIADGMGAWVFGPDVAGSELLLTIWPPVDEPTFVSLTAFDLSAEMAWVQASAQGVGVHALDVVERIAGALKSELGHVEQAPLPPERIGDYDREESRSLEREIQELLETLGREEGSSEYLRSAIHQRELRLQQMVNSRGLSEVPQATPEVREIEFPEAVELLRGLCGTEIKASINFHGTGSGCYFEGRLETVDAGLPDGSVVYLHIDEQHGIILDSTEMVEILLASLDDRASLAFHLPAGIAVRIDRWPAQD
jgi:hypothetical protein